MSDPQYNEFVGRLRRVDQIHRSGGGFEAAGTLGRSFYTKRTKNRPFLRSMIVVAVAFLLIKAVLLTQIGESRYQTRLNNLQAGSQIEVAGAYLMQMDTVTVWLATQLKDVFSIPGR